jgi:hypothetical protein
LEIRKPGFPNSRAHHNSLRYTKLLHLALAAAVWERALAWAQVLGPDWAMDSAKAREVQDSACDGLVSCRNRMQLLSQSAKPFRFSRSPAKVSHNNPGDILFRGTSSLNCTARCEFGNDDTKLAVSNDHRTSSFSDSSCEPLVSNFSVRASWIDARPEQVRFSGLDLFRPSGCRPTRPFRFQHE